MEPFDPRYRQKINSASVAPYPHKACLPDSTSEERMDRIHRTPDKSGCGFGKQTRTPQTATYVHSKKSTAQRSTSCACAFDQTTTALQTTLSYDRSTREPCRPELFRARPAPRGLRLDFSGSGHSSSCNKSCATRQKRSVKIYEHTGLSKTAPLHASHVTHNSPKMCESPDGCSSCRQLTCLVCVQL